MPAHAAPDDVGLTLDKLLAVLERRPPIWRERDLPDSNPPCTRLMRSAGGNDGGCSRRAAMNTGSIVRKAR